MQSFGDQNVPKPARIFVFTMVCFCRIVLDVFFIDTSLQRWPCSVALQKKTRLYLRNCYFYRSKDARIDLWAEENLLKNRTNKTCGDVNPWSIYHGLPHLWHDRPSHRPPLVRHHVTNTTTARPQNTWGRRRRPRSCGRSWPPGARRVPSRLA